MTTEFRTFFREHYDDVVGRLRAGGAGADTAADCAQEAFVRAYARWWRIGQYRCPEAWVQRVATNVLRDHHRGRVRFERAMPVLAVDEASDLDPTEPTVDGCGAGSALDGALETLPPQQRRAIDAYYGQGLSTSEGAHALGISPGAFRFHLHRARSTLRPMLSPSDPGQEA